ncbi:XRE family transcriptional regulator [Salinispora fenicalii]|uniref:XRE family transcriptional regulator n=1 Tax=Salinispora fenicalii TaxID=1137263 RepID=UPI0004BCB29B
MKRKVSYEWRLHEAMAQHKIFTATDAMPLLRDRGIDLSASQVHRLVSGTPRAAVVAGAGRVLRHPRPTDHQREERRRPQDRHRRPAGPAHGERFRPRPALILPGE